MSTVSVAIRLTDLFAFKVNSWIFLEVLISQKQQHRSLFLSSIFLPIDLRSERGPLSATGFSSRCLFYFARSNLVLLNLDDTVCAIRPGFPEVLILLLESVLVLVVNQFS